MTDYNILLSAKDMPDAWYNILPDLPAPLSPPLHPATHQPVGPDDLAPLFPMELIKQEMSMEGMISIPGEILDIYRLWRPTPLRRAYRLEKALGQINRTLGRLDLGGSDQEDATLQLAKECKGLADEITKLTEIVRLGGEGIANAIGRAGDTIAEAIIRSRNP